MTQYFLSLPHDSAEEPTMAAMDPADLQEVFAAVDAFNTSSPGAGGVGVRRWPEPAVDRDHGRQHR